MSDQRWQRISEIFHEALEHLPDHRAAFVREACAGDDVLRGEVESLLVNQSRPDAFGTGLGMGLGIRELGLDLIGKQIGVYRIDSLLGAGGMGEVYRARDTTLGRDVAIKILPRAFTHEPDRLARFEREARLLAILNHPHIGAIYGLEDVDGVRALVLELVEGDTLADRIERGPIPLTETLAIARQIADALDAAHKKGIIHRDLKPSNIKVTPDGVVKVLDFGLAKATAGDGAASDLAQSPTITAGGTREGVVLGTAAYMSPEQARGKRVDKRADIWSFGCVLFEMLTGKRPFGGETIHDTLAAVIERQPDWAALPAGTPLAVRTLLQQCLQKDPDRRLRDIGDATLQPEVWRRSHRKIAVAAALLILVGGSGWFWRSSPSSERIQSIAVLPLDNLSGDPTQEYFADGLTEALIADLAKLEGLRVISRTSMMRYKSARKPLSEIARELDVEAVMEGSVIRSGDQVRITAQLIHAPSERHIWGDTYERKFADILLLQREVARSVAAQIGLQITPADRARLANARQVDPEIYELYLKARYHLWIRRTEENRDKAVALLQQVIEKDPKYAAAWATLAIAYSFTGDAAKQRAAALRAIELDDRSAEAYFPLADSQIRQWDFPGAERSLKRGLELEPNSAQGHHIYSHYWMALGRIDEALAMARRAAELEPFTVVMTEHMGWCYLFARQYDRAIQEHRKLIEMEPDLALGHVRLGLSYQLNGMIREAEAEMLTADELQPGIAQPELAHLYAASGRKSEALKILEEIKLRPNPPTYNIAVVYSGFGDSEQAFAWLEKAYAARSGFGIMTVKIEPRLDPLRSDPRFSDLLRRIGLPVADTRP